MTKRTALLTTTTLVAFDTGYMPTTPAAVEAARRGHTAIQNDAILKRSTDSAAMLDYWDQTDAIVDGVKAMKLAAEMFMPRFEEEPDGDYKNRLKCAKMTNVYRDAVEGLASKPFEQEVSLAKDENTDPPEELNEFAEDVDGSGNNLTTFASTVFFNAINSAIHWIFVDMPPVDPSIRSRADQKARGGRPYWSHVLGRNVLEAKAKVIGGKETLTYVRVYEPGAPECVRIFRRDDAGNVTWELWEKTNTERDYPEGGKTFFAPKEKGAVTIGVIPMVPFMTGRRDGRTFRLFPSMSDAADLQVNLYQNESALEWNKRIGAYSMLTGNGVKPERDAEGNPKKLAIGPNKVLYSPPDGSGSHGEWKFIQPEASVMDFLARDIKETITQLREISRQPLVATMSITTVQAGQAAGKAKSAVGAWALGLKDALENAMVLTCKFASIATEAYDPTVYIYTEFDEFTEGKDLDALGTAVSAGKISDQTYRHELKRRRVLSDEFDEDEEVARLLKQVPSDDGVDTANPAERE